MIYTRERERWRNFLERAARALFYLICFKNGAFLYRELRLPQELRQI